MRSGTSSMLCSACCSSSMVLTLLPMFTTARTRLSMGQKMAENNNRSQWCKGDEDAARRPERCADQQGVRAPARSAGAKTSVHSRDGSSSFAGAHDVGCCWPRLQTQRAPTCAGLTSLTLPIQCSAYARAQTAGHCCPWLQPALQVASHTKANQVGQGTCHKAWPCSRHNHVVLATEGMHLHVAGSGQ